MVRVMLKQVITSLLTVIVGLLRLNIRTTSSDSTIRLIATLHDMHIMLLQYTLHSSTFTQMPFCRLAERQSTTLQERCPAHTFVQQVSTS